MASDGQQRIHCLALRHSPKGYVCHLSPCIRVFTLCSLQVPCVSAVHITYELVGRSLAGHRELRIIRDAAPPTALSRSSCDLKRCRSALFQLLTEKTANPLRKAKELWFPSTDIAPSRPMAGLSRLSRRPRAPFQDEHRRQLPRVVIPGSAPICRIRPKQGGDCEHNSAHSV